MGLFCFAKRRRLFRVFFCHRRHRKNASLSVRALSLARDYYFQLLSGDFPHYLILEKSFAAWQQTLQSWHNHEHPFI
jgi:hypothetical protein